MTNARVFLYSLNPSSVEEWPSGQWQQTVNLSSYEFEGSNPSSSTIYLTTRPDWRVFLCVKAQCSRGFAFRPRTFRTQIQPKFSLKSHILSRPLATKRVFSGHGKPLI